MSKLDRRSFLEIAGKRIGALGVLGATWPALSHRSQSEVPEVAVIGAGAFGGWTALYLREMGLSVTLIDAYGPGNARSSSAGETRQIRAAYGDRELYSRWAIEALGRWKAREVECGGETAEMPGFYSTNQYELAGFSVGVVEKKRLISGSGVRPGDQVIGLLSSGIHSNGYSLVRRIFFGRGRSKADLEGAVPGCELPLGRELLRPTRIYVKPVLSVLNRVL